MHVQVNGVSLFVDVEGAKFVPDGPAMRERPTLLLLHGGPGADHSMFKPDFSMLAEVAQLVYLDLRGNGRSQAGPREGWTLAQWGDDVHALCEVLEIRRPIVLGLSFGGFVAQAYATRHPQHPAGLILESTAARWPGEAELPGLVTKGQAAARAIGDGRWSCPVPGIAVRVERPDIAGSHARRADPNVAARYVQHPAVEAHFFAGEAKRVDFRGELRHVRCPTLVLAGDHDSTLPLPLALEMAGALHPERAQLSVFHRCDHGVHADAPARTMEVIRAFLSR
jgi:pimeloyl-ACP methyl ester carboxylesterase